MRKCDCENVKEERKRKKKNKITPPLNHYTQTPDQRAPEGAWKESARGRERGYREERERDSPPPRRGETPGGAKGKKEGNEPGVVVLGLIGRSVSCDPTWTWTRARAPR